MWLSLLFAMGFFLDDSSGWTCVAQHSNTLEVIDFDSCFDPVPLAVDAATMLEAFHSYAYELCLIGKEQGEGSKRQKAVFSR